MWRVSVGTLGTVIDGLVPHITAPPPARKRPYRKAGTGSRRNHNDTGSGCGSAALTQIVDEVLTPPRRADPPSFAGASKTMEAALNRTALMLAGATALTLAPVLASPGFAQSSGESGSGLGHVTGTDAASGQSAPAGREPVETNPANAPDQEPAFENQTRAPQPAEDVAVATETIAEGLPSLWALEFLPDGRMLVTAKEGRMFVVTPEGEETEVSDVPEVDSGGQGGLLDVALSPQFEDNRTIFFSFSEPREDGNGTSVARATLNADANALENVEVIFRQMPSYDGDKHFGSRIAFAENGDLFVTVGERSDTPIRDQAQDLSSGLGKIFRITPDGAPSEENPFLDDPEAQPEIWSYGHRNLQSAAMDGEGNLWTVEHGPKGGDELNMPQSGLNYGWPVITYGVNYDGTPVGEGLTAKEGMEQPVYYWDPVVAPSGMAFYEGEEFPEWQDAALIGGLVAQGLVVLTLNDESRVATEARVPLEARIRDVKVGPDGAVYAVTETRDRTDSAILKLTREDGA